MYNTDHHIICRILINIYLLPTTVHVYYFIPYTTPYPVLLQRGDLRAVWGRQEPGAGGGRPQLRAAPLPVRLHWHLPHPDPAGKYSTPYIVQGVGREGK